VAAIGGVAVLVAAASVPALAAQRPGGTAASHARPAIGQHAAAGRMSPGAPWIHVATGALHTCGIRADGTLWCWGYNYYGELGTGSQTPQDRPQQVTTPAAGGWASITTGGGHTCAIRTNGTLWCWGSNGLGQLGIGSHTDQDRPQQVTAPAAGGWASVTGGGGHTCAIRTNGTLWCWGYNIYGQLGIGNHTDQDRPQQVTTPAAGGWASVTGGDYYTCATRTGGTLWCWGDNSYGDLGIGSQTPQDRPQQVTAPAAGGCASVTAGDCYTCAIRTGGSLWCWGWNGHGELGIGSHAAQDLPHQVTAPAAGGWASVTANYVHTCATRTGGTLWCWGYNNLGQLGIGNRTDQDQPQQVTIPVLGGWASVTAGNYHTCATRTSGTLWCWGSNEYGQLGIGNHTGQDQPRQVTGCTQPATQSSARQYLLLHHHLAANASWRRSLV
jgi:alpha-tubulin suppressor-like RCC1 family protein